jgi:formimidoylglutamate deiminase
VLLDAQAPVLAGKRGDAVLDSWIFAAQPVSPVRDVYVGGKRVVEAGRHIHADRFAAAYRETLRRLTEE